MNGQHPKTCLPLDANPEHQRLRWLHVSIGMVAFVVAVYVAFLFVLRGALSVPFHETLADGRTVPSEKELVPVLGLLGGAGYLLSLAVVVQLLGRSVRADVHSRFWDQLRMSSLTAWQMTWPRLLTAPLVGWVGVGIGIGLVLAEVYRSGGASFSTLSLLAVELLAGAVLLAACELINCLQTGRSATQWRGARAQVGLLLLVLLNWPGNMADISTVRGTFPVSPFSEHDLAERAHYWLAGLLVILAVMVVLGAWRTMAQSLHLRSANGYWLAATLLFPFLLVLHSSLCLQITAYHATLLWPALCAMVYGGMALVSLTVQANPPDARRRALALLRQGRFVQICNLLPLWHFLLPLATAALLLAAVFSQPALVDALSWQNLPLLLQAVLWPLGYLWGYAACMAIATRLRVSPSVAMVAFGVLYLLAETAGSQYV